MRINLLKAKLVEHGMTQEDVAKSMKISLSAFNSKVNGATEFSLGELQKLKVLLDLSADDIDTIFFDLQVS